MQTAEVISQKSPKKIKTVQSKVVLLDGTEYTCDLEVRHQFFMYNFNREEKTFHCIENLTSMLLYI